MEKGKQNEKNTARGCGAETFKESRFYSKYTICFANT
jgi:hypothetical protein